MFNRRNIKFDIYNNRVIYNALTTFTNSHAKLFKIDSFKIPSYVLREVYMHKMSLDLYCNGKYEKTYSYDSIRNYLFRQEEPIIYEGRFRNKEVKYKLNKVEIRKYIAYSHSPSGKRCREGYAKTGKFKTRALC